jgi:hypothetical protein
MVLGATEKIALGVAVLSTSLRERPFAAEIAAGDTLIAIV